MGTNDTHLDLEERCRLRGLMEMGLGISEIGRRLECHRATINREIGGKHCVEGYRPHSTGRRGRHQLRKFPKFRAVA
jgi:IS30 family transposase